VSAGMQMLPAQVRVSSALVDKLRARGTHSACAANHKDGIDLVVPASMYQNAHMHVGQERPYAMEARDASTASSHAFVGAYPERYWPGAQG
jgi:hypothetical protein